MISFLQESCRRLRFDGDSLNRVLRLRGCSGLRLVAEAESGRRKSFVSTNFRNASKNTRGTTIFSPQQNRKLRAIRVGLRPCSGFFGRIFQSGRLVLSKSSHLFLHDIRPEPPEPPPESSRASVNYFERRPKIC